jgi:alpha-galactosidase
MKRHNIHMLITSIQLAFKLLVSFINRNSLRTLLIFTLLQSPFVGFSQSDISLDEEKGVIILSNALFTRTLKIDRKNHAFYTTSFVNQQTGTEYSTNSNSPDKNCEEFSFKINGVKVSGGVDPGIFDYAGHEIKVGKNNAKLLKVSLWGAVNSLAHKLEVTLFYEIYPDVPVVRKWMDIANKGAESVAITDLAWENIFLVPHNMYMVEIYGDYGRNVKRNPFIGGVEDPAILVYNPIREEGFIVGNEAPGLMKRTEVFKYASKIAVMMNESDSEFPFKRYLDSGESYTSPKSFISLFNGKKWQDAWEGDFDDFIRKYLGVKLFEHDKTPLFYYNTWNPFRKNINEKLVNELVKATSGAGVEYFIIDDGWQTNRGDWEVDTKKFPNGLEPVCENIKSKGMKPGLWIALTDIFDDSRIYKEHPEWLVKNKNGVPENLHTNIKEEYTVCLGTDYFDYMLNKMSDLKERYDIGYFKIDISAVKSAYVLDPERAGCYATNHEGHKDHAESFIVIYTRMMQFFDQLKEKYPDLIIDCTFEIWGYWHSIDYALIQHADVDWLVNEEANPPKGSVNIRKLNYNRSKVIPTSTMLIGNQNISAIDHEFSLLSLFSMSPLMLGDPRKLTDGEKEWYRKWIEWFGMMEAKYKILQFYQSSDVFDAPTYSNWDGCARINTDKNGGVLCFYRNDSNDEVRNFRIPWVEEDLMYQIHAPFGGKDLGKFTGIQLMNSGLDIRIEDKNSAQIYAIEVAK